MRRCTRRLRHLRVQLPARAGEDARYALGALELRCAARSSEARRARAGRDGRATRRGSRSGTRRRRSRELLAYRSAAARRSTTPRGTCARVDPLPRRPLGAADDALRPRLPRRADDASRTGATSTSATCRPVGGGGEVPAPLHGRHGRGGCASSPRVRTRSRSTCSTPTRAPSSFRARLDGIITSPPYPGLIDYHEQHRYAYELLGLDDRARRDRRGRGRAATRAARRRPTSTAIDRGVRERAPPAAPGAPVVIVVNDSQDLYPRDPRRGRARARGAADAPRQPPDRPPRGRVLRETFSSVASAALAGGRPPPELRRRHGNESARHVFRVRCYSFGTTFRRFRNGRAAPIFFRRAQFGDERRSWRRASTTGRSSFTREVSQAVEPAIPGIEVLALEITGRNASASTSTTRRASTTRSASASRASCAATSTGTPSRSRRRASSGRCGRARTSSAPSAARVRTQDGRRRRRAARSCRPASGRCSCERDGGPVEIPYDEIVRANLIDEGQE